MHPGRQRLAWLGKQPVKPGGVKLPALAGPHDDAEMIGGEAQGRVHVRVSRRQGIQDGREQRREPGVIGSAGGVAHAAERGILQLEAHGGVRRRAERHRGVENHPSHRRWLRCGRRAGKPAAVGALKRSVDHQGRGSAGGGSAECVMGKIQPRPHRPAHGAAARGQRDGRADAAHQRGRRHNLRGPYCDRVGKRAEECLAVRRGGKRAPRQRPKIGQSGRRG